MVAMASRASIRMCGALLVVICSTPLIGCGSTSPDEVRAAGAYTAVVRWLLTNEMGDDPDPELALFLESLTADEIPLEVQVEMIGLLEEFENVRFIDEHEEAVDIDLVGFPVHDDGLLIALGALGPDDPAVVRAEIYRSSDEISAFRFTLVESDSGWRVAADPEVIPVEELAGVPDTDD
jgi:hypothetical protein